MLYCPKCKIHIRGYKSCCPLCQGELEGVPEKPAFPTLPKKAVSNLSFFRICTFVMLLVEILMAVTFYLSHFTFHWAWITMIAALAAWIDIWIALYYRNNVLKLATVETFIGSFAVYFIDRATGFLGWSLAWVIPIAIVTLIAATIFIAKIYRLRLIDYVIYIVFDVLFSLLQAIPLLLHQNPYRYPAVISMTLILILAAYILVFRGRELHSAGSKYMHT